MLNRYAYDVVKTTQDFSFPYAILGKIDIGW